MSALSAHAISAILRRLEGGERLRLLIGDQIVTAGEIGLTPAADVQLRGWIGIDLANQLASLPGPDDPEPAAPAPAVAMAV